MNPDPAGLTFQTIKALYQIKEKVHFIFKPFVISHSVVLHLQN